MQIANTSHITINEDRIRCAEPILCNAIILKYRKSRDKGSKVEQPYALPVAHQQSRFKCRSAVTVPPDYREITGPIVWQSRCYRDLQPPRSQIFCNLNIPEDLSNLLAPIILQLPYIWIPPEGLVLYPDAQNGQGRRGLGPNRALSEIPPCMLTLAASGYSELLCRSPLSHLTRLTFQQLATSDFKKLLEARAYLISQYSCHTPPDNPVLNIAYRSALSILLRSSFYTVCNTKQSSYLIYTACSYQVSAPTMMALLKYFLNITALATMISKNQFLSNLPLICLSAVLFMFHTVEMHAVIVLPRVGIWVGFTSSFKSQYR